MSEKLDKLVELYGQEKVLLALTCADHNVAFLKQSINPKEGVDVIAIAAEYLRDVMARTAETVGKSTYADVTEQHDRVQRSVREVLSEAADKLGCKVR